MTRPTTTRRAFLTAAASLGGAAATRSLAQNRAEGAVGAEDAAPAPELLYRISLAQWSLHRMLQQGNFEHLSFPSVAKRAFDIDAVEYVSTFFADQATNYGYLRELRAMCEHVEVASRLIMIDGEGDLAAADETERRQAIYKHQKWVVAAWVLGCSSIRVNARGSGEPEEQIQRAADSLRTLAEYADPYSIDVIVENHGGLSSNGKWLAGVMQLASHPRVGTLPDFGNFDLGGGQQYDRYEGVRELMPWAKAVSAKSYAFDDAGNETTIDYKRMMQIVLDAGYRGYVGIEYEGETHSEPDGVRLTKALLERVRDELASERR